MRQTTKKQNILSAFLEWYFYEAPKNIGAIWQNYLIFYWEFFSIPTLLKTLLAPWKGYADAYGRGFDVERFLQTLGNNLISRFLGGLVRIFTILVGLCFEITVLVLGPVALVVWYLWPLIFISANLLSFYLLF
ncbi:MAG: hypothetical protein NTV62_00880 [Candidatus Gribaldobacteria bacterium]|nr:hypothetical protein [Candidatus Gribaldobacteria bacterium]